MKLPPGISLRDIATVVGVSVSTVSRALNDNDRVSEMTKKAVQDAIEELTTSKHSLTTTFPSTPLLIGVIHSHLSEHIWSLDMILEQVLAGVEKVCRRVGAIPYPWQSSRLLLTAEGEPFLASVNGVIMSGGLVEHSLAERLVTRNLPVVIIGGHLPDLPVSSVAADSQRGMRLATQHLVALGHRRIALVDGPSLTYTSHEKKAGYLAALGDAGVAPDLDLVQWRDGYDGFEPPAAMSCTEALLALPAPPTAIIYASDGMAIAGLRVLQRAQLAVPHDVSVVGFHDDPDARYSQPTLTSVHVDRVAWGEVAMQRLLQIRDGDTYPTRTLLPVNLVVRESTGPAPQGKRNP